MQETCSSKSSVDFQWTTRRYIPEDGTLQCIPIWFPLGFSWVILQFITYFHRLWWSVKCSNKQISQLEPLQNSYHLQPNVGSSTPDSFYSNKIKLNWWRYQESRYMGPEQWTFFRTTSDVERARLSSNTTLNQIAFHRDI
jgi:hypothetical protein